MHRFLILSLGLLQILLGGCATTLSKGLMEDSVQSTALSQERGIFPFIGEKLHFAVRHVATKASLAEAEIRVGQPMVSEDGTHFIPITGNASSVALARLVMRVDDRIEAYIDPKTWDTMYSFKHLDEKDRNRSFYVWFWPEEMSASVERHYKGRVAKRDYVLPPGTMDSVAWIYFARLHKFEKDTRYTWYTFDGWTLNRVTVTLEGENEDVWTELGFYRCYKLKLLRERSDAIAPQGALSGVFIEPAREVQVPEYELATAWISDDDKHLPVRFVVNTGIGDFDLLLDGVESQ